MKSVILKDIGEFALVEKPVPELKSPDDLLIEIEASSICGSDVHIFANPPGIPAVKGTTIGHEMVGKVVETGANVKSFVVGDRLVLDNNVPCGECIHCRSGHPNMCQHMTTIGVDADGAFAEYAVVPARMAVKIPADLPTETAIFAEPLNCVMGAVNKIRLLPGENILVMGAGPIGLYFIKLLALNGAGKIFVSEVSPFRAQYAMDCGATRVINSKEEDLLEVIEKETDGVGVDVAVDAVGVLINDCIKAVRSNGRILLFGNNSSVSETICQADITRKELAVMGSYVGPHTLPATVALLSSGKLDLSHLITHRIRLSEFAKGIEAMRKAEAIEVVITPD